MQTNEEKTEIKCKRNYRFNKIVVISSIILGVVLQIALIFNNNVWSDEAFTISAIRQNWAEMWEVLINDVHPPLYYIILKIATSVVGDSLVVAKLVSILPLALNNIIITILTLKDKETREIKLTGVLLAIYIIATNLTANFLLMSVEIRMYTWAILFVTLSGIYAYKVYIDSSKKNILLFILLSLASALTHYFALVIEIIIYLYLYIALLTKDKNNIKQIIAITFFTILGYSWWIPFAINQFTAVQNEFWMTAENCKLTNLITTIFNLNIPYTIIVILIVILFAIYKLFFKKDIETKEKQEIVFAMLGILIPIILIIIGLILNQIIRPIFYQRYIIPSLGLFWLGIVIMIKHVKRKDIIILMVSIILIIMIITSYPKKYKEEYDKGTNDTLEFMEEVLESNDIILTNITQLTEYVLDYYFPENRIVSIANINLKEENNTIWYFEHKDKKIERKNFIGSGYEIEKVYTGNIGVEYHFDIYRMKKTN